jgi:hypothetical protein
VVESSNKFLIVNPLFDNLHGLSFPKFIAGSKVLVIYKVEFVSVLFND